jgi:hypothetical protein
MSIRLYLIPYEHFGALSGPMYLPWGLPGAGDPNPTDNVNTTKDRVAMMRYGRHDWGIGAIEGDDAMHADLASRTGVRQIPNNLDNTVGAANRDIVRGYLEDMGLPGQWVQNGTAWREVVRTVCGMIVFGQRYDSIRRLTDPDAIPFGTQIQGNLGVQWGNIPQDIRDAVIVAGESPDFEYDMSFISNTTLVRAILKQLADLWGDRPVYFGLEPFNGGQTFTV